MMVVFRSLVVVFLAALLYVSEATAKLEGSVRQVFIDEFMQTCLSGQRSNPYNRFLPEHVLHPFCRCNAEITANRLRETDLTVETGLTARQQGAGYETAHYCRDNLSKYLKDPEAIIEEYPQAPWNPETGKRKTASIGDPPVNSLWQRVQELEEEERQRAGFRVDDQQSHSSGNVFLDELDQPEPDNSIRARVRRIEAEAQREREPSGSPWAGVDLQDPEPRMEAYDPKTHIPESSGFWDAPTESSRGGPGARSMARTGEITPPSKDEVGIVGDFLRGLKGGALHLGQSAVAQTAMWGDDDKRSRRMDLYGDMSDHAHENYMGTNLEFTKLSSRDEGGSVRVGDAASDVGRWGSHNLDVMAPLIVGASGLLGAVLAVLLHVNAWEDRPVDGQ